MVRNKRSKKGMAIVIVLAFSAIILAYGSIIINQYKDTAPVSKMQLDRIQGEFFAKGIQNIILFKIKKFPDFFLKSYRQYAWEQFGRLPKLTDAQSSKKVFVDKFMNDDIFNRAGKKYWTPLNLEYYHSDVKLLNADDFNSETIEIRVEVKFPGKKATNVYVATVNGEMRR